MVPRVFIVDMPFQTMLVFYSNVLPFMVEIVTQGIFERRVSFSGRTVVFAASCSYVSRRRLCILVRLTLSPSDFLLLMPLLSIFSDQCIACPLKSLIFRLLGFHFHISILLLNLLLFFLKFLLFLLNVIIRSFYCYFLSFHTFL